MKAKVGNYCRVVRDPINPQASPKSTFQLFSIPAYDNNRSPEQVPGKSILSTKNRVHKNSVLVSKLNPRISRVWPVRTSPSDAIASTEYVQLGMVDGEEQMLDFFTAVFTSRDFVNYLTANASGTSSSHQRVSADDILNYELSVPSDPLTVGSLHAATEQKLVANTQLRMTLERLAECIFRRWFIDFELSNKKKESQIGLVPQDWSVQPLKQWIDFNPPYPIRRGEEVKHVAMDALPKEGSIVRDHTRRPFTGGSKFQNGDTLLARITPSLEHGKTALVDFLTEGETAFGSTEFIVLHPRLPEQREFIYYLARSPHFREVAITSMTGTSGRQRVQTDSLKEYVIAIPPDELLSKFHEFAAPLFEMITSLADESEILKEIDDRVVTDHLRKVSVVPSAD